MKWMINIAVLMILCGCQKEADVFEEHEPVLQIDAVFFSGEPLPEMVIRKSFNVSGDALYVIPKEEVYLSGALVMLNWNGNTVPVEEVDAGIYQGISPDTIQAGDDFEIEISYEGLTAYAVARVPEYPDPDIQIMVENTVHLEKMITYRRDMEMVDSILLDSEVPISFTVPYIPDYCAIQVITREAIELTEAYHLTDHGPFQPWSLFNYQEYFGENFNGFVSITHRENVIVGYPFQEAPEDSFAPFSCKVTLKIPEPIYAAYMSTQSIDIIPVNVTNVEGGLGLFIGAQKFEKEIQVSATRE